MSTKKKKIDRPQIVEHDVTDDAAAEDAGVAELATAIDAETVEIEVTLSNGVPLTLDVIRDQGDWSWAAVEAMAELNYAMLVNSILTPASKLKLKMAGARVRDFESITDKVSSAVGSIRTVQAEKNEKK